MKTEGKVGEWSVDRWQRINKGIACFAEFALIKKRRGATRRTGKNRRKRIALKRIKRRAKNKTGEWRRKEYRRKGKERNGRGEEDV